MDCFVFMFRCMLMFYGRFKDRNKTCMRLVFLGGALGAAHLRMAAVLSCWVVGWVVLPGWRLLSCPAEIRNHFISKLLKSSTALKHPRPSRSQ